MEDTYNYFRCNEINECARIDRFRYRFARMLGARAIAGYKGEFVRAYHWWNCLYFRIPKTPMNPAPCGRK